MLKINGVNPNLFFFFGEGPGILSQIDIDSLTFHAAHVSMYLDIHKQLFYPSAQVTVHVCISFI